MFHSSVVSILYISHRERRSTCDETNGRAEEQMMVYSRGSQTVLAHRPSKVSMEPAENVIKEVLRAAYQFYNNSAQLAYLLRQLETLQTVSSRSSYIRQLQSSDQVELVECLTFLVDVVRERHGQQELVLRAVGVLLNLSQDENVKKLLYETLNLCPALVSLLVTYSGLTEEAQAVHDALQLLQRITYGHRMDYHQAHVEDLIKFLIPHVLAKTEPLLSPVLGTLANLCRNNLLVQAAIRNTWHGDLKKLLKTLCGFFESQNHLLVIFSLSVFTSLCLNESEGQRVFFEGSNVEQTLQTIFGIIKHSFRTVAWKYAADLLADLFRHPQMQICIRRYQHLPKCASDVLSLLSLSSEDCVADMFELLLSLCAIPSARQSINSQLFTPVAQNSVSPVQIQEAATQPPTPETEPILCCIYWMAQDVTPRSCAPCLALDFLIDSCQDSLCGSERAYPVHLLTPVVVNMLSRTEQTSSVKKTVGLVRLLTVLSSSKHSQELLGSHLKTEVIAGLMEKQMSSNSYSCVPYGGNVSSSVMDDNTKEEKLQLVLLLLELTMKIRKCVPGLKEYLESVLKEPRLLDYLAQGLTSASQDMVDISLHMLCFNFGLDNTRPDITLCSAIACLNKQKQSVKKLRLDSDSPVRSPSFRENILKNKENRPRLNLSNSAIIQLEQKSMAGLDKQSKDQSSVETLIERMEGIMGSKDTKTVEVIEVFEHHIRSLQIKEEHLNSLLEAKSLALTQADRVIAQLRGRQASHSAEMKKLQNVLKDSELKIEQVVSQMNDMKIEMERMKVQYEASLDCKREEMEALLREKDEIAEKCAELEDKLASSRQENKTLSSMISALQEAHEVLKEQYNVSCNQSKQLEEERKILSKQLKDKDAMLQKQGAALQSLQSKYKETEEERAELEKEKESIEAYVDTLRHQLGTSENTCRQLQQRVSVLESVNKDLEEKLKLKQEKVEELESELDKHNQIVSFINNMHLRGAAAGKK